MSEDYIYYEFKHLSDGKVLDGNHAGHIYTLATNGGDFQKWALVYVEEGYFKIVQKATGKVLDGNLNGNVDLMDWNGSDFQKWSMEHLAYGFCILTQKGTGRVLDGNADGQVYTHVRNDGDFQKWKIDNIIPGYDEPLGDIESIKNLPEKSTRQTTVTRAAVFKSERWGPDTGGHVQGLASGFLNSKNIEHIYFSTSDHSGSLTIAKGSSTGMKSADYKITYLIPYDSNYHQGGGLGYYANLLVCPYESDDKSQIQFYLLADPAKPKKLNWMIQRPDLNEKRWFADKDTGAALGKASSVAMTKTGDNEYILVVFEWEKDWIAFYKAESLTTTHDNDGNIYQIPDFKHFGTYTKDLESFQGLGLVYSSDKKLYLVGFHSSLLGENQAKVYSVNLTDHNDIILTEQFVKEVESLQSEAEGVHFKYSGSLRIRDDGKINLCAGSADFGLNGDIQIEFWEHGDI